MLWSSTLYETARVDEVERSIYQMERNGFMLDVAYCDDKRRLAEADEAECMGRLEAWRHSFQHTVADFNWASSQQVIGLLHDHLDLPPSPVWKKGRVDIRAGERKLDETALDWLIHRVPPTVAPGLKELITLRRIRGSIKYLGKLPGFVAPDGYVHPVSGPASDSDDRAGTITWRLACKNPEVMQIPTDPRKDPYRVRRAFIAPPGHTLLVADEKALEVVVLAHLLVCLFDDHQLAGAVAPGAPDIHSVNARRVFGEFLDWTRHGRPVKGFPLEAFQSDDFPQLKQLRQDIKAVWYGLMYGKSAYGFATSLRDENDNPVGEEVAGRIVEALLAAIPGVARYQNYVAEYVVRHHGIPGLGGAWCDLSYLTKTGNEWAVKRAIRIGQNYPCQEGGARIIGAALADITADRVLWDAGLRVERQVHDELDCRVPTASDLSMVKDRVEAHMTRFPLKAPLQVSLGYGANWDEA